MKGIINLFGGESCTENNELMCESFCVCENSTCDYDDECMCDLEN